ncbi:MAG: hypothetical protein IJL69_07680, partial [Oscillospiraceae bacterium]|nr:hypothetical protein [Oscillospiraceae bacterium]
RERAFLELFYEHGLVRRIEEEAAALRAAAREGQRTERLCRAASLRALLEGLAACDRLTPENVF